MPSNALFIIDGGYLLHKVTWSKENVYYEIFLQYIEFIKKNYTKDLNKCSIIFDGYSKDNTSTKNSERKRRARDEFSTTVELKDIHTRPPISQKTFLLDDENKAQFIQLLSLVLDKAGIKFVVSKEDADLDIILNALSAKRDDNNIVIVGQDIDLLVILTQLAITVKENIYFLKPKIGKTSEKFYTQNSFKHPELNKFILFLHAFLGCDTTSAISGMGKKIYMI